MAIPSSGLHSNGFSLVRSILKKNKIPAKLKEELLKPTKIYSDEILKLANQEIIISAAHITGGGIIENLLRSIPDNLTLNLQLNKIKTLEIFKWLKRKKISDLEMMNTFNCGVGFCIIVDKKNISKIKNVFANNFKPYEIGFISRDKNKVNLINSIRW